MKKCKTCGVEKDLTEFHKHKGCKDGLHNECKVCTTQRIKDYQKTFPGQLTKIYSDQRQRSKRRGHEMPTYSKEDLGQWLKSQSNFEELWDGWVESNYDTKLVPSVDRLDDSKGYSLGNIQLTTWSENNLKGHNDNRFNRLIKTNTSGVRGVCFDKSRNKWIVNISIKGKNINLGLYQSKEEATIARQAAEEHLITNPDTDPDQMKQWRKAYKEKQQCTN